MNEDFSFLDAAPTEGGSTPPSSTPLPEEDFSFLDSLPQEAPTAPSGAPGNPAAPQQNGVTGIATESNSIAPNLNQYAAELKSRIESGQDAATIHAWSRSQGVDPARLTGLEANIAMVKNGGTGVQVTAGRMDPVAGIAPEEQAPTEAQLTTDQGDGVVGAFGRGVGRGVTFDFLDEAGAVVDSLVPEWMGNERENVWNSDQGFGDLYTQNRDINRSVLAGDDKNHGTATTVGMISGSLLGPAGFGIAARGGSLGSRAALFGAEGAAQGAVAGVGGSTSESLLGMAGDAVEGAAYGAIGDRVVAGASRVLRPVVGATTQRLRNAGVELTPGQIGRDSGTLLGRGVGMIESGMSRVPVLRTRVADAEDRAVDSWRRAEVRDAISPENTPVFSTLNGQNTSRLASGSADASKVIAAAERDLARAKERYNQMGQTPILRRSEEYRIFGEQIQQATDKVADLRRGMRIGGKDFKPYELAEATGDNGRAATQLTQDASRVLTNNAGESTQYQGLIGGILGTAGLGYGLYSGNFSGAAAALPFTRSGQRMIGGAMTNGVAGRFGRASAPAIRGSVGNAGRFLGLDQDSPDGYDDLPPLGE